MDIRKRTGQVFGAILIGTISLVAHRYIFSLNIPVTTQATKQESITRLTAEMQYSSRQKLIDEKEALEKDISQINTKLSEAEALIGRLKEEIVSLKDENLGLKDDNSKLKVKNNQIAKEKADLEARLSSLKELRKAIRKVKLGIHRKKIENLKARIRMQKEFDKKKLVSGNQGFVIKSGKSLFSSGLRIEINSAK